MQKLIYILLAAFLLTTYSYTENQIKVSIKRNNKGEILLNITGHTSPITVELDGKTTTFNVGDKELNLDEAISVEVPSVDTSSGVEKSNTDNQSPVPPVNMSPYPAAATPI
jgi:archaellum component FlaF (FlaF/FlaG flagellin family)